MKVQWNTKIKYGKLDVIQNQNNEKSMKYKNKIIKVSWNTKLKIDKTHTKKWNHIKYKTKIMKTIWNTKRENVWMLY